MNNKQYSIEDYNYNFKLLQENIDMAKYKVSIFKNEGIKKRGVEARALLMNIKKICHLMRAKIISDMNAMPKKKRTDTEESLAIASEKRKRTIAAKKKGA